MAKKTEEVVEEQNVTPEVEPQGEVQVDQDAKAEVLGGEHTDAEADAKALEQNIEDAKRDGLRNAVAERENQ